MYPACIPHVSLHIRYISLRMQLRYMYLTMYFLMYLGCILYVSWSPLRIHVSCMYLACILHLRYVPLCIHLRYMSLMMYPWCIPHVSSMYPGTTAHTCIPHVSRINPCMYPTCIRHDASKIHVSWFCISVYPDVSWWRVQDTRIVMYPDMYPVWHQGSAQDTCIVMYLMCIPKCILVSFGIRVKYMQNVKIHVFSWIVTERVRYIWDTSGYIRDTCILQDTCRIHAGYIRIRIV